MFDGTKSSVFWIFDPCKIYPFYIIIYLYCFMNGFLLFILLFFWGGSTNNLTSDAFLSNSKALVQQDAVNHLLHSLYCIFWGLPWWLSGKESACQCRRCGFNPWVGKIPWRRKWQCTPVFLPGKSHVWMNLEGYSPWGLNELDMT